MRSHPPSAGRSISASASSVFASLLLPAVLWASPPVEGRFFPEGGGVCRVNKPAVERRVQALRAARLGALPLPVAVSTPSILVMRVSFSNLAMTTSKATTDALFQQVRNYYMENSYNTFFPTFTVTDGGGGGQGSYALPQTLAFYGADCGANVTCGHDALFDAAALAANTAGINFAQFDHLMVLHAGNGQESSGSVNDIWSLFLDSPKTLDSRAFEGFTTVPEAQVGGFTPHSVICHEYGHQIGLPDLYDTGTGQSSLGMWDIMDYPYGGALPSQTPHLGAWSKYFLGFSAPFTGNGTVLLPANEALTSETTGVDRLPVPGLNESFLLEYRWTASSGAFDKAQPMTAGMAVWHVDDFMAAANSVFMQNNILNAPGLNLRGHRGVDLVEADGVAANPQSGDKGANDLFDNGGILTVDKTSSFNGQPTGMTVVVTGGAGTSSLTTQVIYYAAAPGEAITKVINYPNPAGDTGRYPVRAGAPAGTVTTLVVRLARPIATNRLSLDIYAPSGELVRAIRGESFGLKVGVGEPSSDEKWVYEHDWDGKDDDGKDAAGGVYFYRVKAGEETKTGKLVIVR